MRIGVAVRTVQPPQSRVLGRLSQSHDLRVVAHANIDVVGAGLEHDGVPVLTPLTVAAITAIIVENSVNDALGTSVARIDNLDAPPIPVRRVGLGGADSYDCCAKQQLDQSLHQ